MFLFLYSILGLTNRSHYLPNGQFEISTVIFNPYISCLVTNYLLFYRIYFSFYARATRVNRNNNMLPSKMRRLSGLFSGPKTFFQVLSDLHLDHESQYLTFHIPSSAIFDTRGEHWTPNRLRAIPFIPHPAVQPSRESLSGPRCTRIPRHRVDGRAAIGA